MIIGDGADQPAPAAVEFRRAEELAGRTAIDQLGRFAGLMSPGIGEPVVLARSDAEVGVHRAKRSKDVLLEILAQAQSRKALDRDAEHIGRHGVVPASARLEFQRKAGEVAEIFVTSVMLATEIELDFAIGGIDTRAVLQPVGEA